MSATRPTFAGASGGLVIIQNDRHNESYVAAFNVAAGAEKWSVSHDEKPSWATPAVYSGSRKVVMTSSPNSCAGMTLPRVTNYGAYPMVRK